MVATIALTLALIAAVLETIVDSGIDGFNNAVWWAIVTVTTVGYGDMAPTTTLGQILASVLMISGYAIIAVPTGIVAAELVHVPGAGLTTQVCPECLCEGHLVDAKYCYKCSAEINGPPPDDG